MAIDGFDLTGKRALVVGAESAVGQAIGRALAEAGARTAMADALGPILGTSGSVVGAGLAPALPETTLPSDPPAPGASERLVGGAVEHLGGLDVVVSCGDLKMAGPFEELPDAEWDRLVAVNLTTPVRLLRAAGRHMLTNGGGRIIQVVSMLGERGVPHTAAYGACQAGLMALIRALALEWARRNVRVNAIGLGWFEGDPLVGEGLLHYLPMRRLGRPEEVGALAVYLASDAADMMTGQTIWVDGAILSHA